MNDATNLRDTVANLERERDEARAECERLRGVARVTKGDAECMADAVDTLRKIGDVVGCDHADGPDDRARLVRCVRNEVERLTRERDAITGLCYRKVATNGIDREQYYRITLNTIDRDEKTYDTEAGVIAAVRRFAGLDDATKGGEA